MSKTRLVLVVLAVIPLAGCGSSTAGGAATSTVTTSATSAGSTPATGGSGAICDHLSAADITQATGLKPGQGVALTPTYCQWSDASGSVLSLGIYPSTAQLGTLLAIYDQMGAGDDVTIAGSSSARARVNLDGVTSKVIAKLASGGVMQVEGKATIAQIAKLAELSLTR